MAECNRTVFVATETNKGENALRLLPQLSGGRDTSHAIPCRFGVRSVHFKGALIHSGRVLFRTFDHINTMLSVLHAGHVFIIGGGDGYGVVNSVCVLNQVTGLMSSSADWDLPINS